MSLMFRAAHHFPLPELGLGLGQDPGREPSPGHNPGPGLGLGPGLGQEPGPELVGKNNCFYTFGHLKRR